MLWLVPLLAALLRLRGYRHDEAADHSRINWLFGFVGEGEGWHSNHHARQRGRLMVTDRANLIFLVG
jgi:fatty-acid desaturase